MGNVPPREGSKCLEADEAADRLVNGITVFSGDAAQCVGISFPVVSGLVPAVFALVSSAAVKVSGFFRF